MASNRSVDLSIIILSYQSKDHLAVLLPSVFGSKGVEFVGNGLKPSLDEAELPGRPYCAEVIIVDNGSSDGTTDWLPTTHYPLPTIKNTNNGFAAGNNLGIKQSSGKYILVLNPDTKLEPDTLKVMLEFMDSRPDVGISGCKLIKGDGKLDLACRRRFPNPKNSFKRLFMFNREDYNYSNLPEDLNMEVDSVVGAFLLIRKSVIDKIGLLDESFFMYGEDLDWCWRCKAAGYKVWYYPNALALHFKGSSSKQEPFKMLKAFHDSMWIFYKKHYYKDYSLAFGLLVWLGIYGRLTVLSLLNLFKTNPAVSK